VHVLYGVAEVYLECWLIYSYPGRCTSWKDSLLRDCLLSSSLEYTVRCVIDGPYL
jgi:hypothetical protein